MKIASHPATELYAHKKQSISSVKPHQSVQERKSSSRANPLPHGLKASLKLWKWTAQKHNVERRKSLSTFPLQHLAHPSPFPLFKLSHAKQRNGVVLKGYSVFFFAGAFLGLVGAAGAACSSGI